MLLQRKMSTQDDNAKIAQSKENIMFGRRKIILSGNPKRSQRVQLNQIFSRLALTLMYFEIIMSHLNSVFSCYSS